MKSLVHPEVHVLESYPGSYWPIILPALAYCEGSLLGKGVMCLVDTGADLTRVTDRGLRLLKLDRDLSSDLWQNAAFGGRTDKTVFRLNLKIILRFGVCRLEPDGVYYIRRERKGLTERDRIVETNQKASLIIGRDLMAKYRTLLEYHHECNPPQVKWMSASF